MALVAAGMTALARRVWALAALPLLVGCDHATKWVAKEQLEGQPPHRVLGSFLDLQYAENRDVAFNLLRWVPEHLRRPALLIFGALAGLALLVALWRARGGWLTTAALALIAAGAIGNYVDRVQLRYVIDFVHVPHWPVFNVADVYVVAGAALLALSLRGRAQKETATEPMLRRRP